MLSSSESKPAVELGTTAVPLQTDGASSPNAVKLCVYDVIDANSLLCSLGLGIHHIAVEVYGSETWYGRCTTPASGVSRNSPRNCPPHSFREQYVLGYTELSREAVNKVIRELSSSAEWLGTAYHLINHNCQHFAEALASKLLSPETRLRQHRQDGGVSLYREWHLEKVTLPDGRITELPPLIPYHVNRIIWLAQLAAPAVLVDKMECASQSSATTANV